MGHSPVEGNISSCGSLCARVCKDIQHHCKTWSSFLCYVHFYFYRGVKLYNQYKIQHFHWLQQLEKLVEYHQSNLVYFRKCLLCILGQTPWDTSSTFEGGRWGRRLSIFSMWALKSYVAGLLESYFMLTGSVVKSLRSVSPCCSLLKNHFSLLKNFLRFYLKQERNSLQTYDRSLWNICGTDCKRLTLDEQFDLQHSFPWLWSIFTLMHLMLLSNKLYFKMRVCAQLEQLLRTKICVLQLSKVKLHENLIAFIPRLYHFLRFQNRLRYLDF